MSEIKRRNGKEKELTRPFSGTDQMEMEDSIDLVELAYRLLSSWKLIVCLALVFTILSGVYTFFVVTPMYEATSIIYVLNRSDSVINMSDLQIGSALTNDYVKVFKMWEVHERVISKLNLPYSYSEMEKKLTVANATNTRMLDITFKSANPEEASAVANAYAEVVCDYIAETMATEKPSIMSVALTPTNPVSPNKTRNILIGFVLGALLAAGIITVQMLVDDTYKTADDIRKYTGLATLAAIPSDGFTGPTDTNKKQTTGGKGNK